MTDVDLHEPSTDRQPPPPLNISGADGRRLTIDLANHAHTVGELADALGMRRRAVVLIDGTAVDRRVRLDRSGLVEGSKITCSAEPRRLPRRTGDRQWRPRPRRPLGGHRRGRASSRNGRRLVAGTTPHRAIGIVCRPSRRRPRRAPPCRARRASGGRTPARRRSYNWSAAYRVRWSRTTRSSRSERVESASKPGLARLPMPRRRRPSRRGATTRGGSRCTAGRASRRFGSRYRSSRRPPTRRIRCDPPAGCSPPSCRWQAACCSPSSSATRCTSSSAPSGLPPPWGRR